MGKVMSFFSSAINSLLTLRSTGGGPPPPTGPFDSSFDSSFDVGV